MNPFADTAKPRIYPPAYFLLAVGAMLLLHRALPLAQWLAWPWTLAGAVFFLLGFGLSFAGRRRFQLSGAPLQPFEEGPALVTDGVFRFSRNPMYAGMLIMLLGVGVGLGTAGPLAVIPLFYLLLRWRFIRAEEAGLERRFGRVYTAYKARVRRWL
jgi:protein-S-isoprenylcysteine O-methyltransferase Ste14